MNTNRQLLEDIIGVGSGEPISGPWRLAIYDTSHSETDSGKIFVFSEEHENDGSCPDKRHFSELMKEILEKTSDTYILIENFIHANDLKNPRGNPDLNKACAPVEDGILNNLRNCMDTMRLNDKYCRGSCKDRIHNIDPRADAVYVMPDGKLFEAITHYSDFQASNGDFNEAVLTIYEALIHPLSSLFPDRKTLKGRLVGIFETLRSKMTSRQGETFDKIWKNDIIKRIVGLNSSYVNLQRKYPSSSKSLRSFTSDVEELKIMYKEFTNKLVDIFLLAHVFLIQNIGNTDGMVIYTGSLHSLQVEKYLDQHGFKLVKKIESKGLDSCLTV